MSGSENDYYNKTYYTALARERYIQMSKINLIIDLNMTLTVTFDGNGGVCSTSSKQVTYKNTYGLLPIPTKDGFTFEGWYTAEGTKVEGSTIVNKNFAHTLYAHWTEKVEIPVEYLVTFDANGGTGKPDNQIKTHDIVLTLSSKIPERTGFTFLGWGTSSTATTVSYEPGGEYTENSGISLYAVWQQQVIEVTGVTLDKTTEQWIPLKNGGVAGTLSLTATVSPSNATNKTVTWTSSDNLVATVNNGTVTAKGPGVTTITATAGGKSSSVDVYVYNLVFDKGNAYYVHKLHDDEIGYMTAETKLVVTKYSNNWWEIKYYSGEITIYEGFKDDTPTPYINANSTNKNKYFTNYGAW